MRGRFCPVCGRKVDFTIEGLCVECYKKSHPIIERLPEVKVTLCKNCYSYKLGGRWHVPPPEVTNIEELVLYVAKRKILQGIKKGKYEEVEVSLENEREGYTAVLEIKGKSHELIPKSYVEEYRIPLEVKYTLCPACMDLKGKVERAVVQVRAKDRQLTPEEYKSIKAVINKAIAKMSKESREALPIKIKGDKYIDITFSSQKAAKRVASELQKSFPFRRKDTLKVIGVSSTGRLRTKLTIRLLLPEFKKGDIVRFSGKLYKVLDFEKDKVKLLSLNNYRESSFSTREVFFRTKTEVCEEEVEKALVVSITPPYIQFMDLKNYEVYEERFNQIPLWVREGEVVGIVKIDDKAFLIPI